VIASKRPSTIASKVADGFWLFSSLAMTGPGRADGRAMDIVGTEIDVGTVESTKKRLARRGPHPAQAGGTPGSSMSFRTAGGGGGAETFMPGRRNMPCC